MSEEVASTEAVPSETAEQQQRELWLAERRKHITSTDSAALVGLAGKRTAADVYFDKTGQLDRPTDEEEPEWFEWGRRLQPSIARAAGDRLRRVIVEVDPYSLLVFAADPLFASSLDAMVCTDDGVPVAPLECKNVGVLDPMLWGEDGSDAVPDKYVVQVQHEIMCTEASEGFLAALFGGRHLRVYRLLRDDAIIEAIREKGHAFQQNHLAAGVPPAVDDSEGWRSKLRSIRQESQDFIEADEQLVRLAAAYRVARVKRLDIEGEETILQNRLREAIGVHAGLTGPGFRITYKQSRDSKHIDWQRAFELLQAAAVDEASRLVSGRKADEAARRVSTRAAQAIEMAATVKPGTRRFLPTFSEE